MRESHLVKYAVSNASVTVNAKASKATDTAVDIRGTISKDGKPLKGHRLTISLAQVKRDGFQFAQDDNKRTANLTVREFDKGRTVAEGNSADTNKAALAALGIK